MNSALQPLLALVLFAGLILSPVQGQDTPAPASPAEPSQTAAPEPPETPEKPATPAKPKGSKSKRRHSETIRSDGSFVHVTTDDQGNRVSVGRSAEVRTGEKVHELVVVLGDGTVDGEVEGDLVVVLGDAHVNGTIGGDAVNVGGGLFLGTNAVVNGDAVGVLGGVFKEPGARVRGQTVPVPLPGFEHFNSAHIKQWFVECVILARPLSLHVAWVWPFWIGLLVLYLLLTLLFPRAVEATADVYAERTASSFLMGVLSIPLLFIATLVLIPTVIGAPFFIAAVLAGEIVGKAALLFQLGRLVGRSSNLRFPPLAAVLVGSLLMTLLYLTPFLGLLVNTVTNFWAIGAATLALTARFRKESPKPPPPSGTPPFPSPPGSGPGSGSGGGPSPVNPATPVPTGVGSFAATSGIIAAAPAALAVTTHEPTITSPPLPIAEPIPTSISNAPTPSIGHAVVDAIEVEVPPAPISGGPSPAPESTTSRSPDPLRSHTSFPGSSTFPSGTPLNSVSITPESLTLPRGSFLLRVAASACDWILLGLIIHTTFLHRFPNFLLWILFAAYFAGFYVWKNATLGGLVLGLKVVRVDGRRIDLACGLVRACSSVFSVLIGGIGWFWCLWDKEGQAWHDKLAGTVVVRVEKTQPLV